MKLDSNSSLEITLLYSDSNVEDTFYNLSDPHNPQLVIIDLGFERSTAPTAIHSVVHQTVNLSEDEIQQYVTALPPRKKQKMQSKKLRDFENDNIEAGDVDIEDFDMLSWKQYTPAFAVDASGELVNDFSSRTGKKKQYNSSDDLMYYGFHSIGHQTSSAVPRFTGGKHPSSIIKSSNGKPATKHASPNLKADFVPNPALMEAIIAQFSPSYVADYLKCLIKNT
ncbi:hypothetical protein ARMSODRAFT_1012854 [Armillaria solidipes]|uniref:Uncharacterized protein n=1 Tax=Armillaria solidipes TaxID=1076256 RepID=A0A2H3CJA3_9AGAR|nr:hypothetical protein ARMSODRAFT_1012854 [Armillaria solidipes]